MKALIEKQTISTVYNRLGDFHSCGIGLQIVAYGTNIGLGPFPKFPVKGLVIHGTAHGSAHTDPYSAFLKRARA